MLLVRHGLRLYSDASHVFLTNANGDNVALKPSASQSPPLWVSQLVKRCFDAPDVKGKIEEVAASQKLTPTDFFYFYTLIAQYFMQKKDRLTAQHFLNFAVEKFDDLLDMQKFELLRKLIDAGNTNAATDILLKYLLDLLPPSYLEKKHKASICKSYDALRIAVAKKTEHGHEVILAHLEKHIDGLKKVGEARKLVFVEVGTTRENVPGQGSTRKIAEFCKYHALHFITVDMDPHNTKMAEKMFSEMGMNFKAIAMKGEDFLHDYEGPLDFVFLDAYDFDHGNHSELRQSRYEKFLGSAISNLDCHKMHLDCAKTIYHKLSSCGLVCIDDTWLEEGKWTAKGTLAVPYLISKGFEIVEIRNRAVLLRPRSPRKMGNKNEFVTN